MEPTQEQLDSYAEALCQLKEIKDFINGIKCNPDGSYSQINENCCFDNKYLNIEDIIKLISVQLNQEILDRLDNLNNIDIELDEAEMQRLDVIEGTALMKGNFKIFIHRNSENNHLKLMGDFDDASANELISVIKNNCEDVNKVIIHTNCLGSVQPFAKDVFPDIQFFR